MSTALVLSPHLDDAVFSCGGTMALLVDAGWRVVMVTAFTRSVVPAQGFALACQLDKGLDAAVDYMALRRAEDVVAANILGVEARWLDLLEAPHRGYETAPALFGPIRADDDVWRELAARVVALACELHPALVLGPQGLGNHVDHRQMIRAIGDGAVHAPLAYYRDTPYAIRNRDALPDVTIPIVKGFQVEIAAGLDRKIAAACAYGSQLGFQFGSVGATDAALRRFAQAEGGERFLGAVPLEQGLLHTVDRGRP